MERNHGSLGQYRKWAGVGSGVVVPTNATHTAGFGRQADLGWSKSAAPVANLYNSQLLTLKEKMKQAKEQNNLAHQRLANHMLQGSDYRPSERSAFGERKVFLRSPAKSVHPEAPLDMAKKITELKTSERRHSEILDAETDATSPETNAADDGPGSSSSSIPPINEIDMDKSTPKPEKVKTLLTKKVEAMSTESNEFAAAEIAKQKSHIIHELTELADDVQKTVLKNSAALGETNENRKVKEHEKSEEAAADRRRKLKELLAVRVEEGIVMIPLWRHKLNGNMNPKENTVLKGKKLLKVLWNLRAPMH